MMRGEGKPLIPFQYKQMNALGSWSEAARVFFLFSILSQAFMGRGSLKVLWNLILSQ